jgi:hypothetical protein
MILYSLDSSPYSAAVRIAVYVKDLQIEIVEPPSRRAACARRGFTPSTRLALSRALFTMR